MPIPKKQFGVIATLLRILRPTASRALLSKLLGVRNYTDLGLVGTAVRSALQITIGA